MDNEKTRSYDLYKDMAQRTGGELYLGIVGPVRTGKSTFIKRFMDLLVIPNMENVHDRERTIDELPQSAQGKTIMTTEPKFVPKDAATIHLEENISINVRLIDCVGFMVDGAGGFTEDGQERLVKTPWFDYEVPFTQAAEMGTQKVIQEHANIGMVITTDGSFTELPRESYLQPEERTVQELKSIGKPFVILLNTSKPYGEDTLELVEKLQEKYQVSVIPVNCQQMHKEDIYRILENILYEYPISCVEFYMPKWVEMMPPSHRMKSNIMENARKILQEISNTKDVKNLDLRPIGDYIKRIKKEKVNLATGSIQILFEIDESFYYENISELTGVPISGEYQLISLVKELAQMKQEYERVENAMNAVRQKGYGVVTPVLKDIEVQDPVLIRHGNKFGVKIKASSPSIHLIRANVETEIAPIIGSEDQAKDLVSYIRQSRDQEEGIWQTNIFGKSIGELIEDGIRSKITMMDEESQMKLQDTMQKVVNDSNGGLVCIII